jgi:hypothetical protein
MARKLSNDALRAILGRDFVEFLIALVNDAADRAKAGCKAMGVAYSPAVGSVALRLIVKEGLRAAQGVQFTEHEHGFWLQVGIRNLAIWFEYEGISIRCYRVPAGKTPMPGQPDGPEHRQRFFQNLEPIQRPITNKDWIANVAILWSFDHNGDLVELRAVVPNDWNEQGELQFSAHLNLPTTVAELNITAADNFQSPEEDAELLVKPTTREPAEEFSPAEE